MPEALDFLSEIPQKAKDKIPFNKAMAKYKKDPKLFKPFMDGMGYFRAQHFGNHYRIFEFWDKTNKTYTLVIARYGIINKSDQPEIL